MLPKVNGKVEDYFFFRIFPNPPAGGMNMHNNIEKEAFPIFLHNRVFKVCSEIRRKNQLVNKDVQHAIEIYSRFW
jgi:hypothetical protein